MSAHDTDPFEPEPESFQQYAGFQKLNVAGAPSSDTAQVVGSMAHNVSDALAARDADPRAQRVTLKQMQDRIASCVFINAGEAAGVGGTRHPLCLMTLALVTLDNGWVVVGQSKCADPLQYDPEKGKRFAIDDALEQLWIPFGFELAERMHIAEQLGLKTAIRNADLPPEFVQRLEAAVRPTPLTDEFIARYGDEA